MAASYAAAAIRRHVSLPLIGSDSRAGRVWPWRTGHVVTAAGGSWGHVSGGVYAPRRDATCEAPRNDWLWWSDASCVYLLCADGVQWGLSDVWSVKWQWQVTIHLKIENRIKAATPGADPAGGLRGSEPLPNDNGRSCAEGAEAPISILFRQ